MQVPLQITFRHMDSSPALEARIRQRAEELEHFFDRITSCHVTVECGTGSGKAIYSRSASISWFPGARSSSAAIAA